MVEMLKNTNHNLEGPCGQTKKILHHLSVIMDGNRRWAKEHQFPPFVGHQAGIKTVKMMITESIKAGVRILTLYAFSTENWKRSKKEISSLMNLFREVIINEKKNLIENKVKVKFIGDKDLLPDSIKSVMEELEKATQKNTLLLLHIAINYGGRMELCHAFRLISQQIAMGKKKISDINQELISQSLFTEGVPDPDLLIRTGGEKRLSNFLLWQIAYTELWFTKTYWPDFSKEKLWEAFNDYEKRVRKFGGEI